MLTKTYQAPDRIGDILRKYPELSDDDRELVRKVLQKATYLELARLLADREIHAASNAVRQDRQKPGSDPALIAFAILALIAVATLACVILQW